MKVNAPADAPCYGAWKTAEYGRDMAELGRDGMG